MPTVTGRWSASVFRGELDSSLTREFKKAYGVYQWPQKYEGRAKRRYKMNMRPMDSHDPLLGQVSGLAKKLMEKDGLGGAEWLYALGPFDPDGKPVLATKDAGGNRTRAWWAYRRRAKQMIGRMTGDG